MVVGTGTYKDTREAYPLDKKTLNQIVWRSFLAGFSRNGESGESIGWLWAIMPGLKKIHTNEEDLSFAMGHHLEYVETGSVLSTYAMGVVLAMEQCKFDPSLIRSMRQAVTAALDSIGTALLWYILVPVTAMSVLSLAESGSAAAGLLYAAVLAVVLIGLRFAGMYLGYRSGTRSADRLMKNKDRAVKAVRIAGTFIIGAFLVLRTREIAPAVVLYHGSESVDLAAQLESFLPGVLPILLTWLCYHLLSRKGWSLTKCILLLVCIGLVGAAVGFWSGTYEPLLHLF